VHKKIRQLENARHAVLLQVWDHEREVVILCEKFRIVDSLSEQFELHLWAILESSLELCQQRPWCIVKVMQIVEREELADQHAFALSRDSARRDSAHYSSDARQSQPKQLIRGYQGICLKTLQSSITQRFRGAMPGVLSETNATVPAKGEDAPDEVARVLQELRKRLTELQLIKECLVPCFPPRYDVWNFFVCEYRKHIALGRGLVGWAVCRGSLWLRCVGEVWRDWERRGEERRGEREKEERKEERKRRGEYVLATHAVQQRAEEATRKSNKKKKKKNKKNKTNNAMPLCVMLQSLRTHHRMPPPSPACCGVCCVHAVLESFSVQASDLIPRQILSVVQWVPCICERYLQRMGASDAGPPLIELLTNLVRGGVVW
jgi:Exocyst complex component Sec6